MTRLLWLPGVLRAAGIDVWEVSGWQSRGPDGMDPRCLVDHHTASAPGRDAPSLNTVVNGRPDLPGPLCHVLVSRSGIASVVAAGVANHAGQGGSPAHRAVHNRHAIGVEVENNGTWEPWSPHLLSVCRRIDAAICRHLGWGADHCVSHAEWATPKGRKTDPSWDQNAHRAAVARLLIPVSEEDEMAALEQKIIKAFLDGGRKASLIGRDEVWGWVCAAVESGDPDATCRYITWVESQKPK